MKYTFLFTGFLLCAMVAQAQDKPWYIRGLVLDERGEPLSGATVLADEAAGGISDSAGYFLIGTPARPKMLTVRRMGYFARRIPLDSLRWKAQNAVLQIGMNSDALKLEEVTISSRPVEKVFEENYSTYLIDYQFAGPYLLLLLREKNKYLLRLCTDEGRVLSVLYLPDDRPGILHRSCTGAFHVAGERWAWEITVKGAEPDTFPRYPVSDFYRFVEPCAAFSNGYYFYRKMGPFNQSIRYVYFDPAGQGHFLLAVTDSLANQNAWEVYSDFLTKGLFMLPNTCEQNPDCPFNVKHPAYLNQLQPEGIITTPGEAKRGLNNLMRMLDVYNNEQLAYLSTLEMIRSDSVYVPLFAIGDTLYLFNHPGRVLIRVQTVPWQTGNGPMDYHSGKGWQKEVWVDEALGRAYGRFFNKGRGLILKEINLKTGQAGNVYEVPVAPYLAARYRMRNGMLYFIGQPDANIPNRQLYKVNVFSYAVKGGGDGASEGHD